MNYPNGNKKIIKVINKPIKTKQAVKSHLGLDFEDMLNKSNSYYLDKDIAVIYKKPTPIRITKVDYPSRNKAKITEAYYQIPSTTDYNGIYRGYYVDFEAKSCNGKSFTFANLYSHQIEHLRRVYNHHGISFLIILFNDFKEIYVLKTSLVYKCYLEQFKGGRKSIPYSFFKENGIKVEIGINPIVDYLKAVDLLIEEEHEHIC